MVRSPPPSTTDLRTLGHVEFVALVALLTSLAAMAIDSMLPARPEIARDLSVTSDNDAQLVVSAMLIGLGLAQMIFGPLSDSIGRKKSVYAGLFVFIGGSVLAMTAQSFSMLLVGRFLQGAGAAGPRIVSVAIVRDQYKGDRMAKIMSTVMAVFILVPMVAPAIGEAVLSVASWRAIFGVLLVQGMIALVWFAIRQPETLASSARRSLSPRRVTEAIVETCKNRQARGYMIAAGLIGGAFFGYLNSAEQMFVNLYKARFTLFFALLALSLGVAAIVNSRLVERLGMRRLCTSALIALCILSAAFSLVTIATGGAPPFAATMAYLVPLFFSIGILFGNFNALALEPLGHIAGTASAVVGSVSMVMGASIGLAIGRAFNGTITPMVVGFTGLGLASLALVVWTEKSPTRETSP